METPLYQQISRRSNNTNHFNRNQANAINRREGRERNSIHILVSSLTISASVLPTHPFPKMISQNDLNVPFILLIGKMFVFFTIFMYGETDNFQFLGEM